MNKTIINRDLYLNQIEKFINTDLVKVITWQRRCGKSCILLQIIDILKGKYNITNQDIIYVNMEDIRRRDIDSYEKLHDTVKNYKHILIDEIQDIPEREKAIRSLQAQWWYDIYITWSNSNLLSSEISTFLWWRYVSFKIYPLNYQEFLKFHWLKKWKDSFEKFIKYWWLPYLKNLPLDDNMIFTYLNDIVDAILLRDVISRNNIRNTDFYKNLIVYLAKETWNLFSTKNISDYLKSQNINIATNTVIEYLNASKAACFLNSVSRFDLKWKKIFEILHKYYFTDIWIKNALLWWYSKINISWILENVVYNDLISKWWEIYVWELWNKEVDFVCKKGEKMMYLQVSYLLESETTKQREFSPLLEVNNSRKKYVITMDENASWFIDGVERINIIDFLMKVE